MKHVLPDPYLREVDPQLQRVVGVVALLAALPFAALFVFALVRTLVTLPNHAVVKLGGLAVLALIAGFLSSVGWRLAFNRPNSHNSLLPPNVWFAIASLFLLLASLLGVSMFRASNIASLKPLAFAVLLGVAAAAVGVHVKRQCRSQKSAA
jgi:hypothetical protein